MSTDTTPTPPTPAPAHVRAGGAIGRVLGKAGKVLAEFEREVAKGVRAAFGALEPQFAAAAEARMPVLVDGATTAILAGLVAEMPGLASFAGTARPVIDREVTAALVAMVQHLGGATAPPASEVQALGEKVAEAGS
jgi:hypothetical protein